MSTLLGQPIAKDPASMLARAASPSGFIDADIPLLKEMKLVSVVSGQPKVNPAVASTPAEIRDFITWASGSRSPPLPPLAVKILCLKRASISNSVKSVNPSNKRRTGEQKNIEEIDALLRSTGVKDIADPEKCKTQGNTYTAPPTEAPSANTGSKGCVTHVNCDNSAVVALLTEMMKKIDCLESMAPETLSLKDATADLEAFKTRLAALQEHIDALHKRVPDGEPFSALSNNASSANDDLSTVRSLVAELPATEPAKNEAEKAVNAATKENKDEVMRKLLLLLGDRHPTVTKGIEGILREEPVTVGVAGLANMSGRIDAATNKVSELPTNYKAVVSQLMTGLKPTLDSMITNISEQITAMDMTVDEIKADTTNIKQEIAGMRENIRGLYPHTQEHTQMILDELTKRTDYLTELVRITSTQGSEFQPALDALQETIRDLSSRIGTLQRTNGDGRNSSRIAENERLAAEVADLRRRLQESTGRGDDAEGREAELRARIAELESELATLRADSPRARGTITELETRAAERNATIATKDAELERLRAELAQLQASCDGEKAELRAALDTLRQENDALKRARGELAAASARCGDRDELAAEVERLREASGSNGDRIAQLQGELDRMNALLAEKEGVEERLRECADSKAGVEAALARLQEDSAANRESARGELEAAQTQLQERNAFYEGKLRDMEREHAAEIQRILAEQTRICDGRIAEQRERSDETIADLRQQIVTLQNAPNPCAGKDAEIAALTRRCEAVKADAEREKTEAVATAITEARATQKAEDDAVLEGLREQLRQCREELSRCRGELEEATAPALPAPPAPEPPAPALPAPALPAPYPPAPALPEPPAPEPAALVIPVAGRPLESSIKGHIRAGLQDSLIKAYKGFGGPQREWKDLLHQIITDYESGIVTDEELQRVKEFMKIVDVSKEHFGGLTEAVQKYKEGITKDNYTQYVKALLDLFKSRYDTSVKPRRGGTRHRKLKSQRRTRKL